MTTTMRVAILHHQYRRRGGMETYLLDLARGFAAAGDTVDLFVQRADPDLVAAGGPRVHVLPAGHLPHRLRPAAFARRIRRAVAPAAFDLVLSLARTDCQDVVVCGGTHRGFLRALGRRPGWFDRAEVRREARAYANTPVVIAHSKWMADEVVTLYGVPAGKVHVLYPPVDAGRFAWVGPAERRRRRDRLGIPPGRTVVAFPAAGDDRKGWAELRAAFDRLPADRFELVTAGRALAPGRPNVRHLGYLADMRALYGAADLTALPSRYEPFGLVVPESLSCGTPVVVSDRVGAAELLGPGEGRVLDALTPAAIAAGIAAAARAGLRVEPGFVARAGLAVDEHIASLKAAVPVVQARYPMTA